jgi:hypothetical protein
VRWRARDGAYEAIDADPREEDVSAVVTKGAEFREPQVAEGLVPLGRQVMVLDALSKWGSGTVPEGITLVEGSVTDAVLSRRIVSRANADGLDRRVAEAWLRESQASIPSDLLASAIPALQEAGPAPCRTDVRAPTARERRRAEAFRLFGAHGL